VAGRFEYLTKRRVLVLVVVTVIFIPLVVFSSGAWWPAFWMFCAFFAISVINTGWIRMGPPKEK
jgi:hypothetical protein